MLLRIITDEVKLTDAVDTKKYNFFSILKGVPGQQFCDFLVSFSTFLISLCRIKKQEFPEELVSFSSSCL